MENNNQVKPKSLHIINESSNIFDTDNDYIIPLYQRGFEWKEKEIFQLIEDINDIENDKKYYIGTLIVYTNDLKNKKEYEIIDGQQRLTTLFLILNCIGIKTRNSLRFVCRDKSNYTLEHIQAIINSEKNNLDENRLDQNIGIAIDIIIKKFKTLDRNAFLKKLANVIIYQIEVPQNTDLNHYFEIMNTRGEQLFQTDILKANLMSYISKDEQIIFSAIWDACSDMNTYIQMSFNINVREQLFGKSWNELPTNNWEELRNLKVNNWDGEKEVNINEIINPNFKIEKIEYQNDNEKQVKFDSIIDFPFFLIHVLKVYISQNFQAQNTIDEMIDDKKLLKTFNSVMRDMKNQKKIETFVKNFIIYLMRCRFLFDKYIIKRKYLNDEDEGKWSLQELNVSASPKKPYYRNTKFLKKYEKDSTNEKRNTNILMLQAALRVSYISPKVMYWITELLTWLIAKDCSNIKNDNICNFDKKIENYIKYEVKEKSFNVSNSFSSGVDTQHIVFNYLDYLLWKRNNIENIDNIENINNFTFEFRNSVEHWYPQNPSAGSFEKWEETDKLNYFGNLCLIQKSINSKFSNMAPSAKKDTYKNMISKGSLKLRLMAAETKSNAEKDANIYWKTEGYLKHGQKMIEILKNACDIK